MVNTRSERRDGARGRHRAERMAAEGPAAWLHDFLERGHGGLRSIRRGAVRTAILAVLHTGPMHGYQVIQELESRSGGRWRPSAGSVYPTLQQLEDEGLVRSEELDGRRTYTLTDEGRAASEHITRLRRHPWFDKDAGREAIDLRRLALQLVGAAIQVKRMGSPEANREARDILVDSRRRLYRLLAEDEGEEAGGASADENVEERDR
jgi:DNA-binding PadR family transcriptional regulator